MSTTIKVIGLALLSGILMVAAWPVNGFSFILWFAWVPLLLAHRLVIDGVAKRKTIRVLALSYLAFFCWNLCTTYWVYFSSKEGAYMAIGFNSLFMALVFMFFHVTYQKLGAKRGYVALILYWVAFEYLHMDWDLSWPWLTLGNGFANYPEVVQWYAYTGALGGSVWILLANILLFECVQYFRTYKKVSILNVTAALAWVLIPTLGSLWMYFSYTEKQQPLSVVLVQPNVDPWGKFGAISGKDQMDKMMELAAQQMTAQTQLVICPETALPGGVFHHKMDQNGYIQRIVDSLGSFPQAAWLTGVTHLQLFGPNEQIPSTAEQYDSQTFIDDHNSALLIAPGAPFQVYHKSKLVPGPEMFPFAELLKPLQNDLFGNLGGQIGDLGTQKERSVFTLPASGVKVAPVICYESIYGEFVAGFVRNGAQCIAISTNDAWWGDTPGYKQLLAYTRLRAVETRRSIARSANTGISCFINQRGDILQPTDFSVEASISGTIQLNDELTFYVRHGDVLGRIAVLFSGLMLVFAYTRGFLNRKNRR